MSKNIDRYSQIDGYLRAYYFFTDVLTDNRYKPQPLTVHDSEYWLNIIEEDIKKLEAELEQTND